MGEQFEARSKGKTMRFGPLTFCLALAIALAGSHYLEADFLVCWLAAATLVTFLTFGYDKAVAGTRRSRVPEGVLLALAAAGGTVGALLAMRLFRHKTVKANFRRRLWVVVGLQFVLLLIHLARSVASFR